ncbi:hypothetical protein ACFSVJ_28905 [Prauserella oleivorans]
MPYLAHIHHEVSAYSAIKDREKRIVYLSGDWASPVSPVSVFRCTYILPHFVLYRQLLLRERYLFVIFSPWFDRWVQPDAHLTFGRSDVMSTVDICKEEGQPGERADETTSLAGQLGGLKPGFRYGLPDARTSSTSSFTPSDRLHRPPARLYHRTHPVLFTFLFALKFGVSLVGFSAPLACTLAVGVPLLV